MTRRVVVIGVGNTLRGDDGAGPAVAKGVRARAADAVEVRICEEEPSRLIDALGDADVAFIVDAVSTGAAGGTVHRFDASKEALAARELRSSTHALGISDTIELARALGRLPEQAIVFGIEGVDFTAHEGLTAPVADGVARATTAVLEEVRTCTTEH